MKYPPGFTQSGVQEFLQQSKELAKLGVIPIYIPKEEGLSKEDRESTALKTTIHLSGLDAEVYMRRHYEFVSLIRKKGLHQVNFADLSALNQDEVHIYKFLVDRTKVLENFMRSFSSKCEGRSIPSFEMAS